MYENRYTVPSKWVRALAAALLLAAMLSTATAFAQARESLGAGAGVRGTRPARPLEPGAPWALAPGEAFVFASILFVENGKPKYPYGLGKPMWFVEGLSGRWPHLSTEKDGAFFYAVPAGSYEILRGAPVYYTPFICLPYRFEAPQAGKAYYVGALRIELESTVMLGGLWGNYIDSVDYAEMLDLFDAAAAAFAARNPGAAALPLEKALMTRIPGKRPQLVTRCE